jgi:hypothetical protein
MSNPGESVITDRDCGHDLGKMETAVSDSGNEKEIK